MMFPAFLTAASLLVTGVLSQGVPEDYTLSKATWAFDTGDASPLLLKGTVDEVEAELDTLGLTDKVAPATTAQLEAEGVVGITQLESLSSPNPKWRRQSLWTSLKCDGWPVAFTDDITAGVMNLSKQSGTIAVAAGPRKCIIVACNRGVGIFICNDNNYAAGVTPAVPAQGAANIVRQCSFGDAFGRPMASGQAFHSENINVIARNGCIV